MNTINDWANRWGVPADAINDLKTRLTISHTPSGEGITEESDVSHHVRMLATKNGARLWRNNSGVAFNSSGAPVRFGLCNESKQVNALTKSSDLIGVQPVEITSSHVGRTMGVFLARECKKPSWKFSGTKRETAQLNFLTLVSILGGDAAFTTGGYGGKK